MTVTALLPAHNESATIAAAIQALQSQTCPPDRIIVACDNCTDNTAQLAAQAGAEVVTTHNNTARKAGALNQTLAHTGGDFILIADADTTLAPAFIATALAVLDADPGLGAVGAVFSGTPTNLLEHCQANEWARYAEQLRTTGKVWVLSGTAALIRAEALQQVAAARGATLPGQRGSVYLPEAATEDMELTVALKSLGWRLRSPLACRTTTETMPTVRLLWAQRLRWYGGALQVLREYGLTRTTAPYLLQQVMLGVGVAGMSLFLSLTLIEIMLGSLTLAWWSIPVLALFWAERLITARHGNRLLAALLIPELGYAILLQVVYVAAVINHAARRSITWAHVPERG